MPKIITFFHSETIYFIERITVNARRIIYSNAFYSISSPLISIFISAFIWRTTGSLYAVLAYKVGESLFLPTAFYCNGFLLKKIRIQKTFMMGAILGGITSLALVLFAPHSLLLLFVYGCIWGIGNGFYWANRNYLELTETVIDSRQYFFSILSSISGMASIIVPFFAGWFIVIGESTGWYSTTYAYWILFFISFVLMFFCGLIIRKGTFQTPQIDTSKLPRLAFFSRRRLLYMAQGLNDGIGFISTFLLLSFFGNEAGLGTASSIVAICTIVATYMYGRLVRGAYLRKTLLLSSGLYTLCAVAIVVLQSYFGISIYALFSSIAVTFFMIPATSLGLSMIDKENEQQSLPKYSYIIDNEIFLNLGRLFSICLIAFIVINYSQTFALKHAPLMIACFQMIFVFFFLFKERFPNLKGVGQTKIQL
jgi:YQGE family putative transporter